MNHKKLEVNLQALRLRLPTWSCTYETGPLLSGSACRLLILRFQTTGIRGQVDWQPSGRGLRSNQGLILDQLTTSKQSVAQRHTACLVEPTMQESELRNVKPTHDLGKRLAVREALLGTMRIPCPPLEPQLAVGLSWCA